MQEKLSPSTTTMMIPSKATIAALETIGVSSGVSEETAIPIILTGRKSHRPLRLLFLPVTPHHHLQQHHHRRRSARKHPFPGFNLPRPRRHGRLDPICPTFNIDRYGDLIWNRPRPTLNQMSMSKRPPPKCYSSGNRNNDSNFWKRVGGVPTATLARMAAVGSAGTVVRRVVGVEVICVDDGCDVVSAVLLPIPWNLPRRIRTNYHHCHRIDITITVIPQNDEGTVSSWQPTYRPPSSPPLSF